MRGHDVTSIMSSAEKKRLRDRRAQQTLRTKRLQRIAKLEEKVAYCEEHHNDQGAQRLLRVIQGLRRDNSALLQRQERLQSLVRSWDDEPLMEHTTEDCPNVGHPSQEEMMHQILSCEGNNPLRPLVPEDIDTPTAGSINTNDSTEVFSSKSISSLVPAISQFPSPLVDTLAGLTPDQYRPWKILPLNDDDFSSPLGASIPWFSYPERIASSTDTPSSPLDFLYGTRENPLADMIHTVTRRRPMRDPERLAIGWLLYHMTKWLFSPNPTTYARLPEFFKPVLGQTQIPHPMSLDFVPWPRIRLNFIQRWHIYRERRDELFGLMACCIKVRWPWGESILERNERNELCIRRNFYNTFMSESGWGLTQEFISKYPDLLTGVDVRSILYEVI